MTPKAQVNAYRISDELWAKIEPLLPPPKPHPLGCHRPRVPNRQAMVGIFFVLRTGCQWNALNATGRLGGSSSSAHRRFQEWRAAGVFEQLWALGLEAYDEAKGLDWNWLAMDGAMNKAPLGGKRDRTQPHRSREVRDETQHLDGGEWDSDRRRGRGR